jgi:hypothetical protein
MEINDLQDTWENNQDTWENNQDILGMFSFYDKKSKRYDTPFFCQSITFAKRHYVMVTEKESMIGRFKEDFDLVMLGTFDTITTKYTHNPDTIIFGQKPKEKK